MRLIRLLSRFLACVVLTECAVPMLPAAEALPEATPSRLPRWRGFNLLEKFTFTGQHKPFLEEDFRLISEWGFNFVRLPMDYRGYIQGRDWEKFDEESLAQIDQAVEWGKRYGVHVSLNLHRAPGYTVAQPPEAKDLWTDPEAQRVAALHWGMFARRYKGVPSSLLSFNLFNEPADIPAATYVAVVKRMVDAIRAEDPGRLVLCDGLSWGGKPVNELIPLKVGMMTRGYEPFRLTHYQASWVNSKGWECPTWPMVEGTNGTLLSPSRPADHAPLVVGGPIPPGSALRVRVGEVMTAATLSVSADGKELWKREFPTGQGQGAWKSSTYVEQWKTYRCTYDQDIDVPLPNGAKRIEIRCVAGDWALLRAVGLVPPGGGAPVMVGLKEEWTRPRAVLAFHPAEGESPAWLGVPVGVDFLRQTRIDPWVAFQKAGGGVMVGEWGAFNKTPHEVVLRWAEDDLRLWKEAGWGWALWNFRGPFGILDSGREDVAYEDFRGHKLDRKLLELLRKY